MEQRLDDPKITLNSFVVSVTPYSQVGWWEGGMIEKDFEDHHILFRESENRSYLETMFRKLLGS
jgi:hypothetical protein